MKIDLTLVNDNQATTPFWLKNYDSKKNTKHFFVFVFLSFLVHILLILFIANRASFEAHGETGRQIPEKQEMKSYLYIAPKKQIEQNVEDTVQIDIILEEEKIKEQTASESAEIKSNESIPDDARKAIEDITNENQISEEIPQIPRTDKNESAIKSLNRFGVSNTVKAQLNTYQRQMDEVTIEESASELLRSHLSPLIEPPNYTDTYIQLKESDAIQVDCVDTGKKIMSVIAGTMGGNIVCRELEFQEFIDKRQHK